MSVVPLHAARSGRVRVAVHGLRGSPDLGGRLERGLAATSGIRSASASSLTGNVIVHHAPDTTVEAIVGRLTALLRGDIAPAEADAASRWHVDAATAVAADLHSDTRVGLSTREAATRLTAGANQLPPVRHRSSWAILAGQFESLPVLMLAGAGAISLVTGALVEAGAIAAVVALNGTIGFYTESRTERTIESLGAPAPLTARVIRDGRSQNLPAEALVPGDVITLQRGMVVPADARLIEAQALTVSEAALTGESLPVVKAPDPLPIEAVPLADRTNMVYRGTVVTGGSGTALVVATGGRTEVGRIQSLVGSTAAPATPIQKQLECLGRQLAWMTAAAGLGIFVIGLVRGLAPLQILRLALATAVAAVPEGLPMVATSTLALGVGAMRRRSVLVRRLDAIETLAAADVICFDKTGTLTQGTMSVCVIAVGERICEGRSGEFFDQDGAAAALSDERIKHLLGIGSLCSEAGFDTVDGQLVPTGSATENALIRAALDFGLDVSQLRRDFALRTIQHRTEAYRFMATVHATGTGTLIAVKGSPGEVLARCRYEALPGGRWLLTHDRRTAIEALNARMAQDALRVLGFAYRLRDGEPDGQAIVEDLTWVGLVGLADPVRPGLGDMMHCLHRAGLQTCMLTGDQRATARAVGQQIGLGAGNGNHGLTALDAAELETMTEPERQSVLRRTQAFARISPGQKLEVVRGLQRSGAVVAMVGDGINDSPALRAADVGIAFRRDSPPAAREVADIFLDTDDLQALLPAIARGRMTAANIRNAIHYLVSTNTSEILVMLVATAAGFREALSPIQLLWINLISDVLPGIGLAMEPPEPGIMEEGPRPVDAALIGADEVGRLAREASLMTAGALLASLAGAARYGRDAPQTRTMTFGSLTVAQLLHTLTYRGSRGQIRPLTDNPALMRILAGSFLAQSAAFLMPGVRRVLGITPIAAADGLVMLAGGLGPHLAARTLASRRLDEDLYFRRPQTATGPMLQAPEGEGAAGAEARSDRPEPRTYARSGGPAPA
ncbi:cation-translocating P-type ATPase [Methylobacterium nodulans]|uniref:cation-translocating P-type ATPase n=1 Tax=Methylobacterium nodulans TaxID=114616 RepID=UPI001FCC8F58|nr:cation-transporting P-type ATPase [Methylobacterium nodulans]